MESINEKKQFYMKEFVDMRVELEEKIEGHLKGTPTYKQIKKDLDEIQNKLCMFYGILDYCFKQEWVNNKEPYNAYIELDDNEKDKMFILGNDFSGNFVERSFFLSE